MIALLIIAIAGVAIYNSSLSPDSENNILSKQSLPHEIVKQSIHHFQEGYKIADSTTPSTRPTLKTWPVYAIKSEPISKSMMETKATSSSNSSADRKSVSVFFSSESHSLDHHQEAIVRQFVNDANSSVFFVTGYASPDGNPWFNAQIAKKRAESTCETLKSIDNAFQCVIRNGDLTSEDVKRKAVISLE